MTSSPPDCSLCAPLRLGGHILPGAWRHFLPEEAQWLALPRERLADCERCYWTRLGKCRDDCRCCTYFPQLPSFLVGLALRDPASRPAIEPLVRARHALPFGLLATPAQFLQAVKMQAEGRFGHDLEQVCPFFERHSHRCAIHPYRNSVCATFFCEHDHGEAGAAMWQALQAVVGLAETLLGQWAMDEVGLSSRDTFARLDRLAGDLDALQTDGVWSDGVHEALWGNWLGRELVFFEACAEAVMARRDELYEIACQRPLIEARGYERALLASLPSELLRAAPRPSAGDAIPLRDLWYRLELEMRQLSALPFGEGTVQLAAGCELTVNPRDDRLSQTHDEPHLLRGQDGQPLLFCDESETRALRLFSKPQMLAEALFERPEIEALDDARSRLAEWMRRGILVATERDIDGVDIARRPTAHGEQ